MSWFMDFLTDTARQAAPGIHQAINSDIQRKQKLDELQKTIPILVEQQRAMMPGQIEQAEAVGNIAMKRDAANRDAAFRQAVILQHLKNQAKTQTPDDPIGKILGSNYTVKNQEYGAGEEAMGGMGGATPTANVGGLEWLRRSTDVPAGHVPKISQGPKGTNVEWEAPRTAGIGGRDAVGEYSRERMAAEREATELGLTGEAWTKHVIDRMASYRGIQSAATARESTIARNTGDARAAQVATSQERAGATERGKAAAELEYIPSPITGERAPRTTVVKQAEAAGQAIPASERKALSELAVLNQLTESVERDSKNFTEPFFGPVAGRYGLFRERITGQMGDAEVAVRRNLGDIKDTLLRARSGAQINEQEYTRLSRLVPDITDPINVAKAKMKSFKEALKIITDERQRLQGVSGGAIRGIQAPRTEEFPSRQETKTLNGKTYIKVNGRWYEQ